ncbi:MAG: hypothetical protein WBO25_01465 [Acidimicrobiia bacterium]
MVSIRRWALASSVLGLVTLGIYVAALLVERNNTAIEVAPWAMAMALASILAFVGAKTSNGGVARFTLLAATILFGLLGMLAISTIGILFVGAAIMSAVDFAGLSQRGSASTG